MIAVAFKETVCNTDEARFELDGSTCTAGVIITEST